MLTWLAVLQTPEAPEIRIPLAIAGSSVALILGTWALLGRISARFNKALDAKLGPLTQQIKAQAERFEAEASRLETHFDTAILDYERQARNEITSIANSIRGDLKILTDKHNDLALSVNTNRANVDQHTRDLHESKVDRVNLRRDIEGVQRWTESFERAQEQRGEKILMAVGDAQKAMTNAQSEAATRLTRVEEALKFYARVRTEHE